MARKQAALVTLLYVFLCTFGTLTHTHAPDGAGGQTDQHALQFNAPRRAKMRADAGKQTFSTVTHCAFCEWEANCLARTITPVRLVLSYTIACLYVRQTTPVAPFFPTRSSSRAPPAA